MRLPLITSLLLLAACANQPGQQSNACLHDYEPTEEDFTCSREWQKVGNLRVTNRCGRLTEAVNVASDEKSGDTYPVGTIITLNTGEAMAKRGPNFDPAHNNWEYFSLQLSPSGATIAKRGTSEMKNDVGSCMECHGKARDYDFICRSTHGCDPLPISGETLAASQAADPRCSPGTAP